MLNIDETLPSCDAFWLRSCDCIDHFVSSVCARVNDIVTMDWSRPKLLNCVCQMWVPCALVMLYHYVALCICTYQHIL